MRDDWGSSGVDTMSQGMIIYRASRLEALLDPLLALMQELPPRHVLAPHTVIAAHPGMQKWLVRELAIRHGPRGIAANLQVELPSMWLDRLAKHVLGEEAVALREYRREALRWRIHESIDNVHDERVKAYLAGDEGNRARRRFQLSDRLARIYTQYLVYRPDWLKDWFAGREGDPPGGFLAPLWKELRQQIGLPHRGEQLTRLIEALAATTESPLGSEPLHVFGLAHLAPSELSVLRAVSRHRPVVLYVPDPCREYWAGLPNNRSMLRDLVKLDPVGGDTEAAFLQQGHTLLASWGRMGQHFMLALEDGFALADVRHSQDETNELELDTRLHRVQESIRRLEPTLISDNPDPSTARADRSLRVHACHTRLRELEALRDALLRERVENPDLKPSDIIVMMPGIQNYVPLLPAVFGEAGKHDGPLPYHCADVAVARSHPLFESFRQLLDLPLSRLTAPEVVDLLEVPQIARRLNLGIDDVGVLTGWLQNSRVAWGLDAAFRGRFDVPEIPEHTFSWAMDRMLAGYVMGQPDGDEVHAVTLADGVELAPLDGIHGPQSALLGALDRLLVELDEWCADGHASLKASEWAERLERRVESIFLIDPMDSEAREAKAYVLRFIRTLASEPQESDLDPELEFSVVREILLARLDAVPERQRFLMGGVTFCGMVPQRAIPFKVVAVLGLNDGDFPRASSDAGLDLMGKHRRLGDRDVRSDDRYLFLETLMSARDVLHLSFIGEGVRDGKPRNPAAPLSELMAVLDRAQQTSNGGLELACDEPSRPWFVRHPLQPFDEHYFDQSDAALFSFHKEFAGMRKQSGAGQVTPPFVPSASLNTPTIAAASIPLREVFAYYKDPAKQLLANGLNLRLDALGSDRLRDTEPLDAKFEALDEVAKRLFLDAARHADPSIPDDPPDWVRLTGMLPPGRVGADAWTQEREKVAELLQLVQAPDHPGHVLFAAGLPDARPLLINRVIDTLHVHGELRDVYYADDSLWIMEAHPGKSEDELDFKARIGFFLTWALIRLDDSHRDQAVRACLVAKPAQKKTGQDSWSKSFNEWDDAYMTAVNSGENTMVKRMIDDIERRVGRLLRFWQLSQQHPQWYFPATSWIATGSDEGAVTSKWLGGYNRRGERDYSAGYARLLAGERDFSDGNDGALLQSNATQLRDLITLTLDAEDAA